MYHDEKKRGIVFVVFQHLPTRTSIIFHYKMVNITMTVISCISTAGSRSGTSGGLGGLKFVSRTIYDYD